LGYLTAFLVCSINLLFVIACVCFLSLFLPDFISALFTMGILFVGFISDGGYQLINSEHRKIRCPVLNQSGTCLMEGFISQGFYVAGLCRCDHQQK